MTALFAKDNIDVTYARNSIGVPYAKDNTGATYVRNNIGVGCAKF